ncbi:hypothetical protein C3433_05865 [Citrobacter freundii]|uniref:Uncharacterized protein n=1 Tax=Citrobacter arsenatis TaxID=2546350 RepID=A0A4P6WMS9_9ENTR|nr:hypothetical protein C3433_05865 [Citrobacter freundii]QBM24839.1 hypothetical protein E1B03_21330 [Citrobacter arsenatis]
MLHGDYLLPDGGFALSGLQNRALRRPDKTRKRHHQTIARCLTLIQRTVVLAGAIILAFRIHSVGCPG